MSLTAFLCHVSHILSHFSHRYNGSTLIECIFWYSGPPPHVRVTTTEVSHAMLYFRFQDRLRGQGEGGASSLGGRAGPGRDGSIWTGQK